MIDFAWVASLLPLAGAGFVVCYAGDIMTMPGLPPEPSALRMDVDDTGNVVGLS